MSITTRSMFYYDYVITLDNQDLTFNEGATDLVAEIGIKSYTPTQLETEIARAMTEAGTQDYFCSFDRATRYFEISAAANFSLLITSGASGSPIFALIGFTGADLTGLDTYESDSVTGSIFKPQFYLQDYIDFEDNEGLSFATTKKTASGEVEVVGFGSESFAEFKLMYQTDIVQGDSTPIETNASGVSDLREFMRYGITKGPIEFMTDRDTPATYTTCLLEKTSSNSKGISFKLLEMYGKGLLGYFESGKITLRKLT